MKRLTEAYLFSESENKLEGLWPETRNMASALRFIPCDFGLVLLPLSGSQFSQVKWGRVHRWPCKLFQLKFSLTFWKNTGQLFCRMPLSLASSALFSWLHSGYTFFAGNAKQATLCPSQWVMSEDTWCQFVPILVILALDCLVILCLLGFSAQKLLFLFCY